MNIEKLTLQNFVKIEHFDCGNETLNEYLAKIAINDLDGVTHIITEDDLCIAYFTLSCSALYIQSASKYHSLPAVEIKNFAVDVQYQHYYPDSSQISLSRIILDKLIYEFIYDFTDDICGAGRIILYSVPSAVNFYKNSGFQDYYSAFLIDGSSYLEGCIPLIFNYD